MVPIIIPRAKFKRLIFVPTDTETLNHFLPSQGIFSDNYPSPVPVTSAYDADLRSYSFHKLQISITLQSERCDLICIRTTVNGSHVRS